MIIIGNILTILLKLFLIFTTAIALVLLVFYIWTYQESVRLEAQYPPIGQFIEIDGLQIHLVDTGPQSPDEEDAPVILFIHGASANLRDLHAHYLSLLKNKARLIFVDRPGHGYSQRGPNTTGPGEQAKFLARLLNSLKIEKAIIFGHSYGGAVAVAMALEQPQKVSGLIALSAPTHPWTTGIAWYHDITRIPVLGSIFSSTFVIPYSQMTDAVGKGIEAVFEPNNIPHGYRKITAPDLLTRPSHFKSNSADVSALLAYVTKASQKYHQINVPTAIISGDMDTVVSTDIHARNLVKQIENSLLHVESGIGHKPDYVITDIVLDYISRIAEQAGTPLR